MGMKEPYALAAHDTANLHRHLEIDIRSAPEINDVDPFLSPVLTEHPDPVQAQEEELIGLLAG